MICNMKYHIGKQLIGVMSLDSWVYGFPNEIPRNFDVFKSVPYSTYIVLYIHYLHLFALHMES